MEAIKVLFTNKSRVIAEIYVHDSVHEQALQESLIELYYQVEVRYHQLS